MVTAGALYTALPKELAVGPRWLLLVIVSALALPNLIAHRVGNQRLNAQLGYLAEVIMTVFLLWSVVMLVSGLPGKKFEPGELLRSAAALWLCNVVIFSLWYWRLDAGGPYARHKRGKHTEGAFHYPPMTNDGREAVGEDWSPKYIDYLFLAFNTSTALSPTDTAVLGRWAKVLVMLQSCISLAIVVILAGRAVNIM